MKKWSYLLSGVLIGAVVATAGSAFADQIKSMVGQTVAGEYAVKVNGNSLSENAIVVDGKAHVPLRAVSDSLGAGVKVDGKTIQISTETTQSPTSKIEPEKSSEDNDATKKGLEAKKALWEEFLTKNESQLKEVNDELDKYAKFRVEYAGNKNFMSVLDDKTKKAEEFKKGIEDKINEYKSTLKDIDEALSELNK